VARRRRLKSEPGPSPPERNPEVSTLKDSGTADFAQVASVARPAPRAATRRVPLGVILKTWNTGESTQLCLDAVARADALPEQIAIVDLGEDDETRAYAAGLADQLGFALTWLPVGHRLAPGPANRLAFDSIETPLVCLLDNDVLVPRNWLGPTTALLASPDVGLVAPIRPDPFLAYPDLPSVAQSSANQTGEIAPGAAGADAFAAGEMPSQAHSTEAVLDGLKSLQTSELWESGGPGQLADAAHPTGRRLSLAEIADRFTGGQPLDVFGRRVRDANHLQHTARVEFPSMLSSCCLFFDRAVVEEVRGVADPAFDRCYGSEDVDLSWRVSAAGYELVRTADVFVLHFRHTSLVANSVDFETELRSANQTLYSRWRKRLLVWAVDRVRAGDSVADLSWRFIIRELNRNTSFAVDLEAALGRASSSR